jgi:hypothetical protein
MVRVSSSAIEEAPLSPTQGKSHPSSQNNPTSPDQKKKPSIVKLLKSKSAGSIKDAAIAKKQQQNEVAVVRLERYDVLLDDELPELPQAPPAITSKAEYKQYMVLRYEYERRGLLAPEGETKTETKVEAVAKKVAGSSKASSVIESEIEKQALSNKKANHLDDFDPQMSEVFEEKDDDLAAHLSEVERSASSLAKISANKVQEEEEKKKKDKKKEEDEERKKLESEKKKAAAEQKAKRAAEEKEMKSKVAAAKKAVEKKKAEAHVRYKVGDQVESLWEDGMWYASTVTQLDLESEGGPFFLVLFDDFGNDQVCQGSQLRYRNNERMFNVGDMCECKWVEDETYYTAQVEDAGAIQGEV